MILPPLVLTSHLLLAKAQNETWYGNKTIKACVTQYVCEDEKCINAKGYHPIVGKSIACPRKYPFGTQVIIKKHTYICDDRLAEKFDQRYDIFAGGVHEFNNAIQWGKRWEEITLINVKL